jgi:hypothetical protein
MFGHGAGTVACERTANPKSVNLQEVQVSVSYDRIVWVATVIPGTVLHAFLLKASSEA